MNALQIAKVEDFGALNLLANLATLVSTYFKGFTVIVEPYPQDQLIFDPVL
jgi:DNA excision repair protein ERCC-2